MDLRPQGHEIIRTWLFATVVRSHYEHGSLPWANAAINGWILDPDRKKMSKSKGNVVTPMALFEQYGTDAVRYWAVVGPARRRHRVQRGPDEGRPPAGHQAAQRHQVRARHRRRRAADVGGRPTRSTGRCSPGSTPRSPRRRRAFEGFDYARALERTEAFFWWFCDDYVELVKGRAYGGRGDEAGRVGARPRCAPRSTRCSGCSRRSCRSPPRRCGAGGTTAASTPRRGRRPTGAAGADRRPRRRRARCWRACAGPRPRPR